MGVLVKIKQAQAWTPIAGVKPLTKKNEGKTRKGVSRQ